MAKIQYPNPKFWKAKDDINWKKQGENLMEVMGIFGGMLMETDWQAVGKSLVDGLKADGARIKSEYEDFMALDPAEKWDRVINGERSLGRLYRKGAMATVRREWRGIKDTAYDFWEWARMWGMLLMTFSKDLIPAMNSALWYRWMISYFCCHGFMDKNIMGLRGSNLRMSHEVTYQIFRYVAENLVFLSKADRKNGNSTELNKMLFTFDEMTMGQIAAGFPDLLSIPHQLLPMFLVSEIDQLVCIPYIDAVESYGLPSDTCPVPSSECGALVIDALPDMGACFISSSMPCDGSTMASSYFARRFPHIPVFHLCFPVRYLDEETVQMGAEDIKACIKFIEEKTGAKWSWEHYFECMKRFRKWNYEMDGGIDPRVLPSMQKVNKMLLKAYENGETAWPERKMRYRGIVWSCPAHYYANFSNWLANCWGIDILVEMESLNFTKHLETEDKEEALRDLARLYERMVMRRHTNGGYQNVVDECWRQVEAWNAPLVIMYQNVACKNMATVQGLLDEQGRQRGYDLIWVEHDLMDPRTVSRRTMRDKVNEYMRTVKHAEPVDPSLVEFEDEVCM